MIRMVVSSFYNTLINYEEAIPTSTMLEIDRIRNNKVLFTISTNGLYNEILDYNKDFPFVDYIISLNGSCVYDALNNKCIYKQKIAKVDINKKAGDLDQDELARIRDEVNKYLTEGDLRREVNMNIKTKMEINSYEGSRHKKGLPVRGQRTNRNARTRKGKGKTVANKKKV